MLVKILSCSTDANEAIPCTLRENNVTTETWSSQDLYAISD